MKRNHQKLQFNNAEMLFYKNIQSMKKYQKKPVIVEAIQLNERIAIKTLEGTLYGNPGDWLVKGLKNEFYPVRDDIFKATYEEI